MKPIHEGNWSNATTLCNYCNDIIVRFWVDVLYHHGCGDKVIVFTTIILKPLC